MYIQTMVVLMELLSLLMWTLRPCVWQGFVYVHIIYSLLLMDVQCHDHEYVYSDKVLIIQEAKQGSIIIIIQQNVHPFIGICLLYIRIILNRRMTYTYDFLVTTVDVKIIILCCIMNELYSTFFYIFLWRLKMKRQLLSHNEYYQSKANKLVSLNIFSDSLRTSIENM